jgi:hypothetical protein
VAGQFVLPVMINERRAMSPIGYLRISAQLLRRQWNDALDDGVVIGLIGPTAVGYWIAFGVYLVCAAAGRFTDLDSITLWGTLLAAVIACLAAGLNGIFRCALYIYATEGVMPGPFEPDLFSRCWSVRSQEQRT